MVTQFKQLLLPSLFFALFFRLEIEIFKFALALEELTAILIAKEIGISLLMVVILGCLTAFIFASVLSLLNWVPFSRGFQPPRPLLIIAILISASLPLFFLMPAAIGVTPASPDKMAIFGVATLVVSLASLISWISVLTIGILKRDTAQSIPTRTMGDSVMRSPIVLVGFAIILGGSLYATLTSPLDSTLPERSQVSELPNQKLVTETMQKAGNLLDTDGNWNKVLPDPKFLRFVVEVDEPRLEAMGLDFIDVKKTVEKDGSEMLKALMAGDSSNVGSLPKMLENLRLLKHSKGDIYLKDIAMVRAELSAEAPAKDASPLLIKLRPQYRK